MWQEQLLAWYNQEKRDLPWRKNADPYHVWISEIMLQQTRVEAVIDYYHRWLAHFPTIEILANAEEMEVLKCWEGLGYYNRARNIHKCAKYCVDHYNGELPTSYDELLELPGIGSYTAAAISSICHNEKQSAVDGNVLRVYSRLFMMDEDISKQKTKDYVKKQLDTLIPDTSGDFNQAMMELGACVCIGNGASRCNICPISDTCLSYQKGKVYDYPVKGKKKERRIEHRNVYIVKYNNHYLIRKRDSKGLLANLYEFYNEMGSDWLNTLDVVSREYVQSYVHVFSHIEWHMQVYVVELQNPCHGLWVSKEEVNMYPIASAFDVCRQYID